MLQGIRCLRYPHCIFGPQSSCRFATLAPQKTTKPAARRMGLRKALLAWTQIAAAEAKGPMQNSCGRSRHDQHGALLRYATLG